MTRTVRNQFLMTIIQKQQAPPYFLSNDIMATQSDHAKLFLKEARKTRMPPIRYPNISTDRQM